MRLVSTSGTVIIGTYDKVPATSLIDPDSYVVRDGVLQFQFMNQTQVDWDAQYNVVRNGKRIFIDENGDTWPEDQLEVRP